MIPEARPKVSVVMATFNRAAMVGDAVDSLLQQRFDDWELLVVDDGSTDDTFRVIDSYLHRHGNIRYLRHGNRKAARSRNAGIQASFGHYVTFLDSDDRYLPDHLASRVELLDSMPEVDLLSGGFVIEGDPWIRDRFDPDKLVHVQECILCGTLFGRRALFTALGGFKPLDYAEDTDLWERAARRHRVMKIDSPASYLYRRSDDSITRNHRNPAP